MTWVHNCLILYLIITHFVIKLVDHSLLLGIILGFLNQDPQLDLSISVWVLIEHCSRERPVEGRKEYPSHTLTQYSISTPKIRQADSIMQRSILSRNCPLKLSHLFLPTLYLGILIYLNIALDFHLPIFMMVGSSKPFL